MFKGFKVNNKNAWTIIIIIIIPFMHIMNLFF